ncbi:MAG: amidohydrolase [Alphaproteobacteria bacterium]|nr:MAG: amidohydrolase [Alphaproteobacteria bacterium]
MSAPITIYPARKIITMNAYQPFATHVAVQDGKVLGVGSLEDLQYWGEAEIDERFADKVIMPGLVEGHSHAFEGAIWEYCYVGFHQRMGPKGPSHGGLKSIDDVVAHLKKEEAGMADGDAPLIGWGFDPIFFTGPRMTAADLDQVSTTRPVMIYHASMHMVNVNSYVLEKAGVTSETPVDGIVKDAEGTPTGEMRGTPAMYLAAKVTGSNILREAAEFSALDNFGAICVRTGVTTATDLGNPLQEEMVAQYKAWTLKESSPIRLVSTYAGTGFPAPQGVEHMQKLAAHQNEKLRLHIVKLVADGSIQGYTARLKWPGYRDAPNGMWYISPTELPGLIETYHKAGIQIFVHTNGDETSEVTIDAIEAALAKHPRADHRHTLQHCQMADEAQYRRMSALGIGVNIFSNHIYYWGDLHASTIIGPDRAKRLDPAATALKYDVPLAMHTDAPITPMGPLFVAWCAVNRLTSSGQVLGPDQRISVDDALRAITLGAAYSLKMDHEIGSLEPGKWADFAILEEDPYAVDPVALRDIQVWGTVLAGQVFPADSGQG